MSLPNPPLQDFYVDSTQMEIEDFNLHIHQNVVKALEYCKYDYLRVYKAYHEQVWKQPFRYDADIEEQLFTEPGEYEKFYQWMLQFPDPNAKKCEVQEIQRLPPNFEDEFTGIIRMLKSGSEGDADLISACATFKGRFSSEKPKSAIKTLELSQKSMRSINDQINYITKEDIANKLFTGIKGDLKASSSSIKIKSNSKPPSGRSSKVFKVPIAPIQHSVRVDEVIALSRRRTLYSPTEWMNSEEFINSTTIHED